MRANGGPTRWESLSVPRRAKGADATFGCARRALSNALGEREEIRIDDVAKTPLAGLFAPQPVLLAGLSPTRDEHYAMLGSFDVECARTGPSDFGQFVPQRFFASRRCCKRHQAVPRPLRSEDGIPESGDTRPHSLHRAAQLCRAPRPRPRKARPASTPRRHAPRHRYGKLPRPLALERMEGGALSLAV